MTIINSLFDLSNAATMDHQAALAQTVLSQPDASSPHGNVRVLLWEGLGGRSPTWRSHYAVVHQGYLYICARKKGQQNIRYVWLAGDVHISIIPAALAWGKQNVLGVVPIGVELKAAIEMSTSILMQLESEEMAQHWKTVLIQEQKQVAAVTGLTGPPQGKALYIALSASLRAELLL